MAPELRWGERTYLMGIINVTPDSFSGDGLATPDRASDEIVAAALAQGTRDGLGRCRDPGRRGRVEPAARRPTATIRRSTPSQRGEPRRARRARAGGRARRSRHGSASTPARARWRRAALAAGATIVNDVWAARRDPGTADAAAASGRAPRAHAQPGRRRLSGRGVRRRSSTGCARRSPRRRRAACARDRLIVDPGIGFGKATDENLELLHRLAELKAALGGLPLLVGTSRKRFLGELLGGAAPDDRVEGTRGDASRWPSRPAPTSCASTTSRRSRARCAWPTRWCADERGRLPDRLSLLGMRFEARHGVHD